MLVAKKKELKILNLEDFKLLIRKNRNTIIPKPRELVDEALKNSPYYSKDPTFFLENATEILYELRAECWGTYLQHEKDLNIKIGEILVQQDLAINKNDSNNAAEIIGLFLEKYSDHLFELSKSNTNSRRSRAGKEFEAIIEAILLRAGIYFDNQGVIGSNLFETERLGKLVDCVVPGVIEYNLEKRKCSLISMKTSLRERWQEVPEEMKRTGAQEMFLLTLDNGITKNTIESLASHNITLVVPDDLKVNTYEKHLSVYGITQFLYELIERNQLWINRKDLSADYYIQKLKTIELRLKDIRDPYEQQIFEELSTYCYKKLK
ncbi:restriction endonuclease [Lysinibacillus halotolerans]|uniref:Restriction endonuclease n=1 Tax=Lysinibacillus halotolerans TaxID=1368476 RepID=A0A3M8H161_9BACI|nr:restriction endonuclease [Lysinibacillus halotolerans]